MEVNPEPQGVNVCLIAVTSQDDKPCEDRTLTLTNENNTAKIGRSSSRREKHGYEASTTNGYFRNPVISREHALFSYRNKTVYLRDSKSFHGTALNGSRIPPYLDVVVNTNDVVTFAILTGRLAETMNAYSFKIKLNELPHANPMATVTGDSPNAKSVPGTYRAPTVISDDESDMENTPQKLNSSESTEQARRDLRSAMDNLVGAGYSCEWKNDSITSPGAVNAAGSDVTPHKPSATNVDPMAEEPQGDYDHAYWSDNEAVEENTAGHDEVPEVDTVQHSEDQSEQIEEEDSRQDEESGEGEFNEDACDNMELDATQAGEVLEFVDLAPHYEYHPLDDSEVEEEESDNDCHRDFINATGVLTTQILSTGSPATDVTKYATPSGTRNAGPVFAAQSWGHSSSRARLHPDRPTIPISSLLSPQSHTPTATLACPVQSFLNPMPEDSPASSSSAQGVVTARISPPPSSPVMQKTTPCSAVPAFSAVTPSDSEEELSSQNSDSAISPEEGGVVYALSGTKRKVDLISTDNEGTDGIEAPFVFSCPVPQESAPFSGVEKNHIQAQATEALKAHAEANDSQDAAYGSSTLSAERPRGRILKTSLDYDLRSRPPVYFVGATNGPTAKDDDVSQRPRKRLRKMAEAVGYAAIGGAAAGLAILTTMIVTAPDLV